MATPLNVWLLNPYHTGSHRAWAAGYAAHSRHRVRVLAMQGQFWKWRMQGAALELAEQARTLLGAGERPDLLLATSMTNLPAFLALTRSALSNVPTVLYMHENQLTYPDPPGQRRDLTYGTIQHLSMLAADRVCFNSAYHLAAWFDELPRLLKHFPDYTHPETAKAARAKSLVLPVGCDLHRFDEHPEPVEGRPVFSAPDGRTPKNRVKAIRRNGRSSCGISAGNTIRTRVRCWLRSTRCWTRAHRSAWHWPAKTHVWNRSSSPRPGSGWGRGWRTSAISRARRNMRAGCVRPTSC